MTDDVTTFSTDLFSFGANGTYSLVEAFKNAQDTWDIRETDEAHIVDHVVVPVETASFVTATNQTRDVAMMVMQHREHGFARAKNAVRVSADSLKSRVHFSHM